MKKLFTFLAALLFLGATLVMSQPVPGKKFELSTAISFTSFKISGDSNSESILILPVRFGYYIWKGLEIEPELALSKFSPGGHVDFNLSGNLAYNFKTSGEFVPFLLAGAGFGNGYAAGPVVSSGTDITATLLNFGGGVKYVLGKMAAIRAEYRYTHNRLEKGSSLIQNLNLHQFFVGIAIFF